MATFGDFVEIAVFGLGWWVIDRLAERDGSAPSHSERDDRSRLQELVPGYEFPRRSA
jgi:hypothetical protein